MNTLRKIKSVIMPNPELTPEQAEAATEAARIALDVIRPTIR